MEERSKALKHRKEQFYNDLVTVQQGKDLMRLEANGRKKKSFKAGKEQYIINFVPVLQEIYLMRRETNR